MSPRARQVIASVSAGLLMASMMCTWGYPAAALPQMEQDGSRIHLSPEQASWFATVTLMMCIPGSVLGAATYEWFGPRRTMLALIPVLGFSTVAMVTASWMSVQDAGIAEILLLTCRVLQGAVVALLNPFISVYTYEVCDQSIRGSMTSFIEVWATLGYLLSYIAGCFLSWETTAWVLPLVTLLPSFTGILFSPESPLWLARKGKEDEAKVILNQLRPNSKEVMIDLDAALINRKDSDITWTESLQVTFKRSNVMAVIASSLILITNQLTGFSVIAIYVVHIFNAAGVGLESTWSSVVVGSSRMVFSTVASLLLGKFSRRLLLTIGNSLTGIASVTMGIFFYLQNNGSDVSSVGWMPLLGLVVYMVGYAGAVGPTTWTVGVEVLPGPVRSAGFGIGTTSYAIAAFILSKLFTKLQGYIGLYGVFWIFAGGSLSYIAVILSFIPETYGMSVQDIENYWTNRKKVSKDVTYV